MAFYKSNYHLKQVDSEVFDKWFQSGMQAPHSGIYRCTTCAHEVALTKGQILPQIEKRQLCTAADETMWELIVLAVSV